MTKVLKNISISHAATSLTERERYHLNQSQKEMLFSEILNHFKHISGLMILATCNRTEIYFEAENTGASEVRDFFIQKFYPEGNITKESSFFDLNNKTADTVFHLLQVANGLRSAVVGDGQILSQIKDAYTYAFEEKMQGSVLERAIQSVHKSHKRISNESSFRNGSQSTAYRALKMIEEGFGRQQISAKRLLILGAGEISVEVLKYLSKFSFQEVYISNRTASKAAKLSEDFQLKQLSWEAVEKNEIEHFDAIITAVSNRKDLIKEIIPVNHRMILVDLAMPTNINSALKFQKNIELYDLDAVTDEIEQTQQARTAAIDAVETIIQQEVKEFMNWYKKAEIREFLSSYKNSSRQLIERIISNLPMAITTEERHKIAEAIAQKLAKNPAKILNNTCEGELSENNMELLKKAFTPQF